MIDSSHKKKYVCVCVFVSDPQKYTSIIVSSYNFTNFPFFLTYIPYDSLKFQ